MGHDEAIQCMTGCHTGAVTLGIKGRKPKRQKGERKGRVRNSPAPSSLPAASCLSPVSGIIVKTRGGCVLDVSHENKSRKQRKGEKAERVQAATAPCRHRCNTIGSSRQNRLLSLLSLPSTAVGCKNERREREREGRRARSIVWKKPAVTHVTLHDNDHGMRMMMMVERKRERESRVMQQPITSRPLTSLSFLSCSLARRSPLILLPAFAAPPAFSPSLLLLFSRSFESYVRRSGTR